MAKIEWEYGKWDCFFGYICDQCHRIFPFLPGALYHEEDIESNNGICPNMEKAEGKE